mmetsp:Transcript_33120/g.72634  ORF Transcript_33120/g.72634 Transcript_33120/m.72634 type:complete len:376 (+) Transcript_33120:57-1184(+)
MTARATATAAATELPTRTADGRISKADECEAAESDCFLSRLQCIQAGESANADNQEAATSNSDDDNANSDQNIASSQSSQYVDKKPRWWRQHAGRRGTRSQRAALSRMSKLGYVIERASYGDELDLVDMFAERPRCSCEKDSIEDTECISNAQNTTTTTTTVADDSKEYWLEIGFGRGENLLASAKMNPARCYIGADVHQPGACIALGRMEEAANTNTYWDQAMLHGSARAADRTRVEDATFKPYDNVRIYCGDGIKLLHSIPAQSLSAIVLPFPDPWPNTLSGHSKFRVIQPDTLPCLERVLKCNGMLYLATDDVAFDEWCRDIFDEHGKERGWYEIQPCPDRSDWLPAISTYEEKGVKEGRCINLRCWRHLGP